MGDTVNNQDIEKISLFEGPEFLRNDMWTVFMANINHYRISGYTKTDNSFTFYYNPREDENLITFINELINIPEAIVKIYYSDRNAAYSFKLSLVYQGYSFSCKSDSDNHLNILTIRCTFRIKDETMIKGDGFNVMPDNSVNY